MTDYMGRELPLFARVFNWKRYYAGFIGSLGGRVLEVGAGEGGTTRVLCDGSQQSWLCLEPDPALLDEVEKKIVSGVLPACCHARIGTVQALPEDEKFDCILYIDVLEHIPNDRSELALAARHLQKGGRLVVLAPAFPLLCSPFDKAIGHFRRYTKKTLAALQPAGCDQTRLTYLDSLGFLVSLANRLLLRQGMPGEKQLLFWDRVLVPLSRVLDPLVFHGWGRAVLAIWTYRQGCAANPGDDIPPEAV
jgi:SAM-dependent methyltransferase